MNTITQGAEAPDFTLKNQFGEDITLSTITRESPVLLVFYPFAFSGICTGELCSFRDTMPTWSDASVRVAGISCDPMFTQRAWADAQGYDFSLLSDFWPHGEVARSYGVFDEQAGFAIRGTFLVDASMSVVWALVNDPGEAREFSGALEAASRL